MVTLTLSILTTIMEKKTTKGQKKFWEGKEDRYVYCLDFGDGFIDYTYISTHPIVYFKYVQCLIYQLYFNKVVKKKVA